MFVIVAVATRPVSTSSSSAGWMAVTLGAGVSRTAAACSGVRPAARRPLSSASAGRSTLISIARRESPSRSTGSRVVSSVPSTEMARSASPSSTTARAAAASGAVVTTTSIPAARPTCSTPVARVVPSGPATTTSCGLLVPSPRLAMTMIAATASALMINVTRNDVARVASVTSRRATSSIGRSTAIIDPVFVVAARVEVGRPADEGEEHLGQAATVEREVVHGPGPAGGVEHRPGAIGGRAGPVAQRHPHPPAVHRDDVDRRIAQGPGPGAVGIGRARRSRAPARSLA